MSKETKAILRAVLYEAESNDSAARIRIAIRAMCEKDDIDAVMQSIAELKKLDEKEG